MAYRLSRTAEDTLVEIYLNGLTKWGSAIADRYDALLFKVFSELGDNPMLLGYRAVPCAPGILAYAIRLSRDHVPAEDRIMEPRHMVIYRVGSEGMTDILGIVHDHMVLDRMARRLSKDASF